MSPPGVYHRMWAHQERRLAVHRRKLLGQSLGFVTAAVIAVLPEDWLSRPLAVTLMACALIPAIILGWSAAKGPDLGRQAIATAGLMVFAWLLVATALSWPWWAWTGLGAAAVALTFAFLWTDYRWTRKMTEAMKAMDAQIAAHGGFDKAPPEVIDAHFDRVADLLKVPRIHDRTPHRMDNGAGPAEPVERPEPGA